MSNFLLNFNLETVSETLNSNQTSMTLDRSFEIQAKSLPENLFSKPHRSSDSSYKFIRSIALRQKTGLTFTDFKLIRQIGSGDIGTVYLCHLSKSDGSDEICYYAMKVVDKEAIELKKKMKRVVMEKEVLKMLDHPFLPILHAEFENRRFSCVVMEFCSGGDLHSLRHKQLGKRFSLGSVRFYAAEVLVALEYLHMLGIIYRDLKPENVLIRSDGHIMLSDFDLSLKSDARPSIEPPYSLPPTTIKMKDHWSTSCLPNRVCRSRKVQTVSTDYLFVAEPVGTRSDSFVGTHEYISPEVAAGRSHGNAVDWWAFGVFIYELLYGRTPFSGENNEVALKNILEKPLVFPGFATNRLEMYARDLMSGLLVKEPGRRLGCKKGAAEVKRHPFFKGLKLELIRSYRPPEIPCIVNFDSEESVRLDHF